MKKYSNFEFYMPAHVLFGVGRLKEIGKEVAAYGKRAVLITYEDSPWITVLIDNMREKLKSQGVELVGVGRVETEPEPKIVDEVASLFSEEQVEVVIGLGGGSVLDASKGLAVVLSKGGKTWDYVGREKVKDPVLPIVAVPTTAGTGSEVTPYAIFMKSDENRKAGIVSPYISPKVSILDPELTVRLPPRNTAISGIDAFAHAIESFTSPTRNTISSGVARQALKLIGRNLLTAYRDGEDMDARSAMLIGSSLAGIAIAHAGTGIAHAIGATLGGFYHRDHGWLVGIVLPEAIRYNTPVASELYYEVAEAIGLDVSGLTPEGASEKLAEQVDEWLDEMGLSATLKELGVSREKFPAMIEDTSTQNSVSNNIRQVNIEAIESFYERLY